MIAVSGIKDIPGGELVYAAATFAVAISQVYDVDEINILSGFFSAVGDGLAVIAAQQTAVKAASQNLTDKFRSS